MTLLARPAEWVGSRGTGAAVACLAVGALALTLAALAWEDTLSGAASATECARAAIPGHACESPGGLASLVLGTLFAPAAAVLAAFLLATGAACLLRPQGRLGPESQRLLDDATRHHAAGGLSQEGFQATRERLHARAARRSVPQAALALSLFGASLAVVAFLLAGGVLTVKADLAGLGSAALPGTRAVLGTLGACTVATLAGLAVVLPQASRSRAHARLEASALQQMLADLESDILDEVRRSAPPPEPAAAEP